MIAVVSHDAGGAEVLSSWLQRTTEPYCLVLDGPAKSIFQRKLGKLQLHSLSKAIQQCEWILCGTSWQSNLERQAIIEAKSSEKKVVAFLDHWVNYDQRFNQNGCNVYPDEIWVSDVDAAKLAQFHFPSIPILLKKNPYFEDLENELKVMNVELSNSKQSSILYVCEPISEHALLQHGDGRYWGYTEEDALQFFLENLNILNCNVSKIKIRPHPSENKNKYDWAKEVSNLVEISGDKPLIEEVVGADMVVGCESMAMVVGLLAKKRVVSSIPLGGKSCSLPHSNIEHLQNLLAEKEPPPHV